MTSLEWKLGGGDIKSPMGEEKKRKKRKEKKRKNEYNHL